MIEGEKGGLPVYASQFPNFRIDGRAIPGRLVLDPTAAGLQGSEIHWIDLRPTATSKPWQRTLLRHGDNQWSISVVEFDGTVASGMRGTTGTARFAAAVLPPGSPPSSLLETDGWSMRVDWANPEHAPGFTVTRHQGESLSGYARSYARLPVHPAATLAHARNWVALRPIDLVLSAYEAFARIHLDGPRTEPLDSPTWSWLFEVLVEKGVRRRQLDAVAIGDRGRAIAWGRSNNPEEVRLQRDDIVLLEDATAILLADSGGQWLSNDDLVLHAFAGEVDEGRFAAVPGKTFRVVRLRRFDELRLGLSEAGYGDLGQEYTYGPDVRRALREFEADHGLPVDGVPDEATLDALSTFLDRMQHPSADIPAADSR